MIRLERAAAELEAEGWVVLCELRDVPGLTARHVHLDGHDLLVCRHRMSVHVLSAICPHQGLLMDDAEVVTGEVVCPHHHFAFELRSGRCATQARCSALQVFPCEVSDGRVWVRLAETVSDDPAP